MSEIRGWIILIGWALGPEEEDDLEYAPPEFTNIFSRISDIARGNIAQCVELEHNAMKVIFLADFSNHFSNGLNALIEIQDELQKYARFIKAHIVGTDIETEESFEISIGDPYSAID